MKRFLSVLTVALGVFTACGGKSIRTVGDDDSGDGSVVGGSSFGGSFSGGSRSSETPIPRGF